MRFTRTTIVLLASGLLLAAAAAAAWWSRAHPSGALEQIVVAANTEYVAVCPLVAAQENGYFRREGLNITFQRHNSGKAALEATLAGRARLATTADIPVMFAAMREVPLSVVATIFRTDIDHGIVGNRSRGIEGPATLKGKRIGVTLSTSGHFVLHAFLNRQRLAASDVTMVNLQPNEFAAALARGDVDAVATWEPFLGNLLRQLGPQGVVFYGEDVYEIPYNMVGQRAYVTQHPAQMQKLVRGLIDGVQFCEAEPDAARALMASTLQIDTSKWKTPWPSFRFKVALDQGLILALEDETRWATSNGLSPPHPMPNFLDYLYLDALEAVAPAAVTVIH